MTSSTPTVNIYLHGGPTVTPESLAKEVEQAAPLPAPAVREAGSNVSEDHVQALLREHSKSSGAVLVVREGQLHADEQIPLDLELQAARLESLWQTAQATMKELKDVKKRVDELESHE